MTNVCCESTARDAMMLNFKTIMVTDGNAAMTDEDHNASLSGVLPDLRRHHVDRHADRLPAAQCAQGTGRGGVRDRATRRGNA